VRVLICLKEELASFLLDGAENGKGASLCANNGDAIEERMKSLLGLWNGMWRGAVSTTERIDAKRKLWPE